MAVKKPVDSLIGSTTTPKPVTRRGTTPGPAASNPIARTPQRRGGASGPPVVHDPVGNVVNTRGPVALQSPSPNRGWGGQPIPNQPKTNPNNPKHIPTSARAIVNTWLAQWGLGALGAWAWDRYKELGGGQAAFSTINLEMVNQPAFNQRFPAYKKLAEQGEAMSPAEMIAYEQTAKQIFHNAGIPQGFYDTPSELATFMVNNVSASELKSRVDLASQAVTTAPQDVRDQLQTLYGLSAGALTAYYLNPTKALPVIQQQFTAAQIGAQGTRTGVGQLTAAQADHLAAIGVTDASAQQGFSHLGTEQGLFQQQRTGEAAIGLDVQLGAEFDNSAAARLRILKQQQSRLSDFQGNSGEALGQSGVGGLGRTDKSA